MKTIRKNSKIVRIQSEKMIGAILSLISGIDYVNMAWAQELLQDYIASDEGLVLGEFLEGDLISVGFATIDILDGERIALVHYVYVDPHSKKTLKRMVSILESWCRNNNLKSIAILTRRNPRTFQRRLGFKVNYFLMSREVN